MDEGRDLAAQAYAARDAGEMAKALDLYARAAEAARRDGDLLAAAHRLRHIADIHREAGRDPEAAPFYDEALALYRARTDTPPLDLANALRPLAILKEQAGRQAEAAQLWAEAKALYEIAGINAGVRESESHLARLV